MCGCVHVHLRVHVLGSTEEDVSILALLCNIIGVVEVGRPASEGATEEHEPSRV